MRGIAAHADAGIKSWGSGGMFVPELFGETAAGGSAGRAAHRVNGSCDCQEPLMNRRDLRDQSKRDSSAAWRGSFAGANEEDKDRATSLGMTGLGSWLRWLPRIWDENRNGLCDQSKRDSSAAWRGSFAGANEEDKDRATSLGMTGLGSLVEMVAKIKC